MNSPFSFKGELSRLAYAVASTGVFFVQHVFVYLMFFTHGGPPETPWWFWLNPLRAMAFGGLSLPAWTLLVAIVVTLIVDWLLVAFAFRRAKHARGNAVFATLAVVPVVQVFVILWLSFAPQLREPAPEAATTPGPASARTVALGLLVGAALSVATVALSTLVFRLYGYSLFMAAPFVIGLTIAYFANREAAFSVGQSSGLVLAGLALGGVALLGFAMEGAICLIMGAPLIAGMGFLGGLLGRALARAQKSRGATVMCVALLPALLASEAVLPPSASFESVESIEVAATPEMVWDAVVHMGPIPEPPPAPFRWGLAYPMAGEIQGTGVGAIRRGVFSTGIAYERVTEWEPPRRLTFMVLSDPPTMRELSPYQNVHAPHVVGYFKTTYARFTITPLSNGTTRLSLATQHELDLEPALYWLPFAQWVTRANKARVLQHFRQQAEQAAVGAQ